MNDCARPLVAPPVLYAGRNRCTLDALVAVAMLALALLAVALVALVTTWCANARTFQTNTCVNLTLRVARSRHFLQVLLVLLILGLGHLHPRLHRLNIAQPRHLQTSRNGHRRPSDPRLHPITQLSALLSTYRGGVARHRDVPFSPARSRFPPHPA